MLIIGVQAIGHMTSLIYWTIRNLINEFCKIIVFVFSTLVIVHSNVHNMGMLCQNLFVIYLNPKQEKKISSKCKSSQWLDNDHNMWKCDNHGDDNGMECSDGTHNTYWMACVENKLVGCS
jgi:hypothetical protein